MFGVTENATEGYVNTRSYMRYKGFKSCRDVVDDWPRSDRPLTPASKVNIAIVKKIVTGNPHFFQNFICLTSRLVSF